MRPFVGQVVIYRQPDEARPHNGTPEHPALVTRVHSDVCVNLTVFYDAGPFTAITSVMRAGTSNPGGESWDFRQAEV